MNRLASSLGKWGLSMSAPCSRRQFGPGTAMSARALSVSSRLRGSLLVLLACGLLPTLAQNPNQPQDQTIASDSLSHTNQAFREVEPGVFQLDLVRLDQNKRLVSLPAVVNLTESPVEYLLVTDAGKIHESILRTQAQPFQVHLAMLLLGVTGAGTNHFPTDPSLPLPGTALSIQVQWKNATGDLVTRPAEALSLNLTTQQTMPGGAWTYTGSVLFQGTFLAQQEGSLVSLFLDPVALVNNGGPDRDNDEVWRPHAAVLPPEETPVSVLLQLPPATP